MIQLSLCLRSCQADQTDPIKILTVWLPAERCPLWFSESHGATSRIPSKWTYWKNALRHDSGKHASKNQQLQDIELRLRSHPVVRHFHEMVMDHMPKLPATSLLVKEHTDMGWSPRQQLRPKKPRVCIFGLWILQQHVALHIHDRLLLAVKLHQLLKLLPNEDITALKAGEFSGMASRTKLPRLMMDKILGATVSLISVFLTSSSLH